MQGKYNFIKLENVILRNFSLYKKNGKLYEVNETINEGVYCLAGANGLGKTTFLNAINYGLTGIILEPNKDVFSPAEIVSVNKRYTERYFSGRITQKDAPKSEIELLFKVNDKYFRIVRGFFERDGLRLLEIYSTSGTKKVFYFKKTKESATDLNNYFQNSLSSEIGFANFDYFIFYQLYVLTFDENRRMIFWDDRASSNALAVAFNSEPKDAEKLSDLIRRMEKHESNGRNARWQATQANNKVKELQEKTKTKKTPKSENLEAIFKKLYSDTEKSEKLLKNIGIEYDTMLKRQSHINSEIFKHKLEHTRLFSRYSKPRSKLIDSTNIQLSLKRQECCLCGSHGTYIIDNIEKNIHKEKCPLCSTAINESNSSEQNKLLELIQKNDKALTKKNLELENITLEIDRKKEELDMAEIGYNKIKLKLDDFTEENPNSSFKSTGKKDVDSLVEQYLKQYKLADNEAKSEYSKRDALKPLYETLLKKVELSYKQAETVFVPTFKKLAKSFIGLELNINLNRSNKGMKLVLELQDTARTESFQLSESQRFFLDIALRMTLAIFLASKKNGATMFVDTPEGSLDIAYESRVGNMFAQFATVYKQNLFMTANINASQLLVSLAENCGKEKMQFRRMLDWTDLSEIQKHGEALFKKVYVTIENALNKKKTK